MMYISRWDSNPETREYRRFTVKLRDTKPTLHRDSNPSTFRWPRGVQPSLIHHMPMSICEKFYHV